MTEIECCRTTYGTIGTFLTHVNRRHANFTMGHLSSIINDPEIKLVRCGHCKKVMCARTQSTSNHITACPVRRRDMIYPPDFLHWISERTESTLGGGGDHETSPMGTWSSNPTNRPTNGTRESNPAQTVRNNSCNTQQPLFCNLDAQNGQNQPRFAPGNPRMESRRAAVSSRQSPGPSRPPNRRKRIPEVVNATVASPAATLATTDWTQTDSRRRNRHLLMSVASHASDRELNRTLRSPPQVSSPRHPHRYALRPRNTPVDVNSASCVTSSSERLIRVAGSRPGTRAAEIRHTRRSAQGPNSSRNHNRFAALEDTLTTATENVPEHEDQLTSEQDNCSVTSDLSHREIYGNDTAILDQSNPMRSISAAVPRDVCNDAPQSHDIDTDVDAETSPNNASGNDRNHSTRIEVTGNDNTTPSGHRCHRPAHPPAVDVIPDDLHALFIGVSQPLWHLHHTWNAPIRQLLTNWMFTAADPLTAHHHRLEATYAILCLPGTVVRYNRSPIGPTTHQWLLSYTTMDNNRCARAFLTTAAQLLEQNVQPERTTTTTHFNQKRLTSLMHDGRLRAATMYVDRHDTESTASVLYDTAAATSAAAAPLHPTATEQDLLDNQLAADSTPVHLTASLIEEEIIRLSKESAPGISGWTYKVIRALFVQRDADFSETAHARLLDATTGFFNAILADQLAPGCMQVFNDSRLVLLQPRPDKIRPIAIADSWLRIALRCALRTVAEPVQSFLGHGQLCVGVRFGTEVLAALDQHIFDQPNLLSMHLDFKNAFNSIHRSAIENGLAAACPGLLRVFHANYSSPSELYAHTTDASLTAVATSSTGCRQGDPLSMLYFAVGIHFALQDTRTALLQELGPLANTLHIGAYADDVRIAMDSSVISAAFPIVRTVMENRTGLTINLSKSMIVGQNATPGFISLLPNHQALGALTLQHAGCVSLGVPIGTFDFRESQCVNMVDKMSRTYTTMKRLGSRVPLQCAFAIATHCVAARPQYLARNTERKTVSKALTRFDQHQSDFLMHLVGPSVTPNRVILTLYTLPISMGGLGIRNWATNESRHARMQRNASVRTALAQMQSYYPFTLTFDALDATHPDHLAYIQNLAERYREAKEGLSAHVDLSTLDMNIDGIDLRTDVRSITTMCRLRDLFQTLRRITGGQSAIYFPHTGTTALSPTERGHLLHHLLGGVTFHLRDHARGYSGLNWKWAGGCDARHIVPDASFRALLRHRLCLPIFPPDTRCETCSIVDLGREHGHSLRCLNGPAKGLVTNRHNVVRDDLAALIRKCIPTATVSTEVQFLYTELTTTGRTPTMDIVVTQPGPNGRETRWMLDVSIRNAASRHAPIALPVRKGTTITHGEKEKREHYRAFLRANTNYPFVAFVMDSSGSLGVEAQRFLLDLDAITGSRDATLAFRTLLATRIAKGNARILLTGHSTTSPPPPQPDHNHNHATDPPTNPGPQRSLQLRTSPRPSSSSASSGLVWPRAVAPPTALNHGQSSASAPVDNTPTPVIGLGLGSEVFTERNRAHGLEAPTPPLGTLASPTPPSPIPQTEQHGSNTTTSLPPSAQSTLTARSLACAPPLSSRRDAEPDVPNQSHPPLEQDAHPASSPWLPRRLHSNLTADSFAPSSQPAPTAIQPASTLQWTSLRALAAAPPLSSRQNDAPRSSSSSRGPQTATRRTTQLRTPTPFPGQSTSTPIPASHPSSRPLATATDPSLVTSQATAVGSVDLVPSPSVDRYSRRPCSPTTADSTASSSDSIGTSTHDSDHSTHGRHPRFRAVSDIAAAAPSYQPATSPVQPASTLQWTSLRALAAAPPLSSRQDDAPRSSSSRGSRSSARQTIQRRSPTPPPSQSTSIPTSHQSSRPPATATDPSSVTSQATAIGSVDLVPRSTSRHRLTRARGRTVAKQATNEPPPPSQAPTNTATLSHRFQVIRRS